MTDPTPVDLLTWVQRQAGVSREDAERIVNRITADAWRDFTEQMAAQPPPEPARLQPISITFTAEVETRAITESVFREMAAAIRDEVIRHREALA